MSSATSTSDVADLRRGNVPPRNGPRKKIAPQDAASQDADGFRVSHFFILLSLMAATVAVVMARPSAPENLILLSLTIAAAGVAAVAFYRTVAPLVTPGYEEEREPLSTRLRQDLEREKALTLRSIKELEFDRSMGKVSAEDFEQMADRLRARAIGIMKQLDAGGSVYRQQIEKDLAARLVSQKASAAVEIAPEPPARARLCACGTSNDADARFCKSCGTPLVGSAS
jgi:hypothetical protein